MPYNGYQPQQNLTEKIHVCAHPVNIVAHNSVYNVLNNDKEMKKVSTVNGTRGYGAKRSEIGRVLQEEVEKMMKDQDAGEPMSDERMR